MLFKHDNFNVNKYQLLLYNDLKLCIDYCEKTYGKDYWCSLYD